MGLFGKSKKAKEKEYLEKIHAQDCKHHDFLMTVRGVFALVGEGTVIAGIVQSGMCREGERAVLVKTNGQVLETQITGIDLRTKERRPNGAVYTSEMAGLKLRGLKKEEVEVGDRLVIRNAMNGIEEPFRQ